MDPIIEDMINGFRGTIESVLADAGDEHGEKIKGILAEMVAAAEGADYSTFIARITEKDLMNRYNAEISSLRAIAGEKKKR